MPGVPHCAPGSETSVAGVDAPLAGVAAAAEAGVPCPIGVVAAADMTAIATVADHGSEASARYGFLSVGRQCQSTTASHGSIHMRWQS